jgi:tetratricopeptide (TPR) repeat protein
MYLYIPLGIFVVSLVGIVWIASRKFVYLKKLEPETIEATSGDIGFWTEMFPELTSFFKKIKLRQYNVNILSELEKTLRKLRILSMKIDTFTNKLIHRVRKSTKQQEAIIIKKAEQEEDLKPVEIDPFDLGGSTKEELKQKEQYLIIEIAKNPKDAPLYKELGSLYMRTGELEDAKQSFEKALELEPDDTTKRKLGRVLGKLEEKK